MTLDLSHLSLEFVNCTTIRAVFFFKRANTQFSTPGGCYSNDDLLDLRIVGIESLGNAITVRECALIFKLRFLLFTFILHLVGCIRALFDFNQGSTFFYCSFHYKLGDCFSFIRVFYTLTN